MLVNKKRVRDTSIYASIAIWVALCLLSYILNMQQEALHQLLELVQSRYLCFVVVIASIVWSRC